MQNLKLRKLTFAALAAAIIFIGTYILIFPLPGSGYANLGDCFIITTCCFLGLWSGTAAAAVGAALADLLLGFTMYAPATFVIKALMAVCIFLIYNKLPGSAIVKTIIAAIVAELVMIAGYLLFESILYGFPTALLNVIGNSIQGVIAVVFGSVLSFAVSRIPRLAAFLSVR